MTRDLAVEVRALQSQAEENEAFGRRIALLEVLELLDDVDRGILTIAELRRRIEAGT